MKEDIKKRGMIVRREQRWAGLHRRRKDWRKQKGSRVKTTEGGGLLKKRHGVAKHKQERRRRRKGGAVKLESPAVATAQGGGCLVLRGDKVTPLPLFPVCLTLFS